MKVSEIRRATRAIQILDNVDALLDKIMGLKHDLLLYAVSKDETLHDETKIMGKLAEDLLLVLRDRVLEELRLLGVER